MNFNKYWLLQSKLLTWFNKPSIAFKKNKNNSCDWFPDGKLNVYHNCVTKNIESGLGNKIAIYCINKKKEIKKYTYNQIDRMVCLFVLNLNKNIKKNKKKIKVMIHASSSIESAIAMLACSKLGYHFSVIFEDLADEAIRTRINLFKPDIFFSKINKKFKKNISTKTIFTHFEKNYLKKNTYQFSNKIIGSKNELFTLFTSGSTGVPKGVVHSTGGYLLYSKYTCKLQFGMNKNSIVLTASDAGWINGHTYALFGPLSFGATTVLIESPMLLLDSNLLKKILNLKISILYLPVTLIRLIKAVSGKIFFQTKHLKTLGSMGEPLAPSIANWFAKHFTNKNKSIVNTYFQTETAGIISSPTFKESSIKCPHGSVGKTISKYVKLNKLSKNEKKEIKIEKPWPGCMVKIINGPKEWNKYWDKNNNFRLFDLATMKKKNIYVHGRVDDVINIRGHRIGSEEIESTVLKITQINECCAISVLDDLEGFAIYLFVVSKKNNLNKLISDNLISNFGTFALPKKIYYLTELPKTRSGKILRRLLRSITIDPNSKNYGDLTTILNSNIIEEIKYKVKNA